MTDQELRERIVTDPNVMVGKPRIRETRIPVPMIVKPLVHDATFDEMFEEYPRLTREDNLACLLDAADMLDRAPSVDVFVERGPFVAAIEGANRGSSDD